MTQSQTAKRRRDVEVVTTSATVVWVSLTGAVSRKAAEQERDSGQRDECLTRLDRAFRVFRGRFPRKCLHDPGHAAGAGVRVTV
jgi:hypothetical protein